MDPHKPRVLLTGKRINGVTTSTVILPEARLVRGYTPGTRLGVRIEYVYGLN